MYIYVMYVNTAESLR